MSREEIVTAVFAGRQAVLQLLGKLCSIICMLNNMIAERDARIAEYEERIKALEHQLHQNSRNSHNPPSRDRFDKPKRRRTKSDEPAGGQKGHPGHTLPKAENPDHVIRHQVDKCERCTRSLEDVEPVRRETRQVVDLPPLKIEVTEHQIETKICPDCSHVNQSAFPEGVQQPVQYGPNLKALVVYLTQFQLLPYDRTRQLFADLFDHPVSTGTLVNINQSCAERLQPVEAQIITQLRQAPVIHCDETGVRLNKEPHWLHVVSTERLTYYFIHRKRGKEAMDEMNVLPDFHGTAVHDFWSPYFRYDCRHGVCNAHILRELTAAEERTNQTWPKQLAQLLNEMNQGVQQASATGEALEPAQRQQFEERYQQLIEQGWRENPPLSAPPGPRKRGRPKKTKTQNLLDRLEEHQESVLAFLHDPQVPFTNNQAEQDVRMAKVQQKISGTFRSTDGAQTFCRIRGYISTARKHAVSTLEAIRSVFNGTPFVPEQPP